MIETVIICTLLYVGVALSLAGMGLGTNTSSYSPETAMADCFQAVGLGWMTYVIYVCALFGLTASISTNFMATVRVVQSFGRDGLLP